MMCAPLWYAEPAGRCASERANFASNSALLTRWSWEGRHLARQLTTDGRSVESTPRSLALLARRILAIKLPARQPARNSNLACRTEDSDDRAMCAGSAAADMHPCLLQVSVSSELLSSDCDCHHRPPLPSAASGWPIGSPAAISQLREKHAGGRATGDTVDHRASERARRCR
jgi:hypothetical protein